MLHSESTFIDTISYPMQPSKEGYIGNAIIFLNTKLNVSYHDQNNLVKTAKLLRFEHHVFRDLSQRQYHNTLYHITNPPSEKTPHIPEEVWRARILSEHEAILVIVVSHGNRDCFLTGDGKPFPDKHIYHYLNENECTLMMGKPKVIFFNKCRTEGTGGNEGLHIVISDGVMEYRTYFSSDSSTHSNFLHIYTCCKGTYSLRRIDIGSFVISRLPEEFEKCGIGKEFGKFIQIFRSQMISEINMRIKHNPGYAGITQCVATECDTLLQDIYFPRAPGSESLEEMEVEQSHGMDVYGTNKWECLNTLEFMNKDASLKSRFLWQMKMSKKSKQLFKQDAQKSPVRRLFSLNCLIT